MSHSLLLQFTLILFCHVEYFSYCTLPLWMIFILPLKEFTMFSFFLFSILVFFTTRRGVLVSCGFCFTFLRLKEEYWFRAVFTTRRGVLVSCGFLFFLFFFVLLTARSVLVHASEVSAEAFCSCPSNKAERQVKAFEIESNQHRKGIEEEEIKYSKQ